MSAVALYPAGKVVVAASLANPIAALHAISGLEALSAHGLP
eukprot:CAMPEP_0198553638 /NCGR_PEP_ID=MMETSP1462-20131121/80957_1 /TAXON_ID=1333877 /ORGANISM="Brandtodinium nutriculum, Strain RCC3387" /LENGTH=40 /DNA_ID= /DNA_START= /DNA_END= /DNA_ORIENTATION=